MVATIYNAYEPDRDASEANDNDSRAADQYLLLNQIAYNAALYLSGRLWMAAQGHRTPLVALGRFPGKNETSDEAIDVNDFLD